MTVFTIRYFITALLAATTMLSASATAHAFGPEDFMPGTAIPAYGAIAKPQNTRPVPSDQQFKVAFDVSEKGADGQINRRIESAARFINMHVTAGVPLSNLNVAVVVHGEAAKDLLVTTEAGAPNPNEGLIKALIAAGGTVTLCGQTAAFRDIDIDALVEGVDVSLSAMTAHATLQQQGYTLNPF